MPVFMFEFDVSRLKSGSAQAVKDIDNVSSSADKAATAINGLWQDKQGKWRNKSGQFASDAEKTAARVGKASSSMSGGMKSFGGSAQDAGQKIKTLATQVLGLVGVYKTLDGVLSFVKRGMDFNASLESSQIAIASVISATNNISTAEGKALDGAEKFNAAQEISKDIMDEIQVLALQTTATFDSLADGVAGIIAPATKAGVSIEKLPKFAVVAAQAMTTMKIPVQQMRTEIESLLSGNINKAQDLLATNLGITGAMVRDWQKQGTLVEELNKRMEAFVIAGAKVADSWSGLKGNMEDALNFLSGKSGKGIFEGAKQSYRELLDLMVNTEGKVGVGKDIENIMGLITEIENAIGDKLIDVTRDFINTLKELNKPENLDQFKSDLSEVLVNLKDIGNAISGAGEIVGGVISTSLSGWQSMPKIVQDLGIIGAVAFGWQGRAALVGLGVVVDQMEKILEFGSVGQGGADAYQAYWAKKEKEASGQNIKLAPSHGPISTEEIQKNTQKQTYNTKSSIGTFKDGATKGNGKAESARRSLEGLNAEIAKLRGEGESFDFTLSKKLMEIAKLGKDAGLSIGEITAKQKEFADAATTKRADDLARALADVDAKIAGMWGDQSQSRSIKLEQEIDSIRDKLKNLGAETPVIEEKISKFRQVSAHQFIVEDAQLAASFMKELAQLSGEYGASTAAINEQLRIQADIYGSKLPESMRGYVDEWERLQRLQTARDPMSGLERGMRKYISTATDAATQFEGVFTTAFQGIGNIGGSALEEIFERGTFSADRFFLNLSRQLTIQIANAATNQVAGAIFGFIGNAIGGMFGGGLYGGAYQGGVQTVPRPPVGASHGGGIIGFGQYSSVVHDDPRLYANAPRYHDGYGLKADERRAILQTGETVLSRTDTAYFKAVLKKLNNDSKFETNNYPSFAQNLHSPSPIPQTYASPQITINPTIIDRTERGVSVEMKEQRDNNGNVRLEYVVGDLAAKQANTPGTNLNRSLTRNGMNSPAIRR